MAQFEEKTNDINVLLSEANKVAVSSVVGGVTPSLQGGKFGHGMVSAGIGSSTGGLLSNIKNDVIRVGVAGIMGGASTRVTGGKFANGAATAAFSAIVNAYAKHQHRKNWLLPNGFDKDGYVRWAGDGDPGAAGPIGLEIYENALKKMEYLAKKVYEDYPSLKELDIKVIHEPDYDLDENTSGSHTYGKADITNRVIRAGDFLNDNNSQANILHEMLHIDEAVAMLGSEASNFGYLMHEIGEHSFRTLWHDPSIKSFGEKYYSSLKFGIENPNINGLSGRKK